MEINNLDESIECCIKGKNDSCSLCGTKMFGREGNLSVVLFPIYKMRRDRAGTEE